MAYSARQKQKIFNNICECIVNGMSLRSAIKELKEKDKIHASDFFRWLREDEDKNKQYAHACLERVECMREDILDIADNGTNDWMTKYNSKGDAIGLIVDKEAIQRSKLRVDARQWHMSKVNPKKYGITPDSDDKNDDNEITINIIDATK